MTDDRDRQTTDGRLMPQGERKVVTFAENGSASDSSDIPKITGKCVEYYTIRYDTAFKVHYVA